MEVKDLCLDCGRPRLIQYRHEIKYLVVTLQQVQTHLIHANTIV